MPTPAFGQADLSNCEREQIHLAGSIQPHGALLVLREHDLLIVQASVNAAAFLNVKQDMLGHSLETIEGNLAEQIRPHLSHALEEIPHTARCRIGKRRSEFDVLIHRPHQGGVVVELERAGPAVDLSLNVEKAVQTVLLASSLRTLCDETARIFKDLTGYDRVMVYRFDDKGHGEVFSERRKPELEPYLGNRYPASDIPLIARRLYERNRIRILSDVEYKPIPLSPRQSPLTGQDLDMSMCFLRSMSPIHVQYLKNMGVAATLVVSIVVGGKLWGLVACHHYVPRFVHFEVRAVCELLAETIATRIAALDSFVQARAELSVRRLEQRMIEAISRDGDWRASLFDTPQTLLQPVGATGVALLFEGQVMTTGEVPGTQELRSIALWLDSGDRASVVSTASLGLDEPKFEPIISVASGILATPVSTSLGEYIIWFRPEQVRTVTWGGDPLKPVLVGDDPTMLSPRRSFAQWHQVVEGTAEPWTVADLTTARLIGETVADVVLQFRSVRMLIAQNQLEHVSEQVRMSELPVIIANSSGRDSPDERGIRPDAKDGTNHPRTARRLARSVYRTGRDAAPSPRPRHATADMAEGGAIGRLGQRDEAPPRPRRPDLLVAAPGARLRRSVHRPHGQKSDGSRATQIPGRHHRSSAHHHGAPQLQGRPHVPKPAFADHRECATRGAGDHRRRRCGPHAGHAGQRQGFGDAIGRTVGAIDLACEPGVERAVAAGLSGLRVQPRPPLPKARW